MNSTHIQAITPALPDGLNEVTVTNPNGTSVTTSATEWLALEGS